MTTAQRMMDRFAGMEEAHGVYIISKDIDDNGKHKGKAFTKREPITLDLWEKHIKGKDNLGVIPINSSNKCVWGALDIDDYRLDLKSFSMRVHKLKIPVIPLRSKSGGCHLVLFLSEPVEAKKLQIKLRELAATLGYGTCEVFPKQSKVLIDKGDLGNWLNMPYFGGDRGTRYALDKEGKAIKLEDFLNIADKIAITPEQLDDLPTSVGGKELSDGPPCLQSLINQGFPQGTRNNGLFALGVYARKAFPDTWEEKLDELNSKYMDPPLDSKEVQVLIKQIGKKDYNYRCTDQPLIGFCNSAQCRTRKYGVGGGAMPSMVGLRKIPTDQPVWFLEINGTTVELSTEDLQQQMKFQKVCISSLNIMPPKLSDRQWQNTVQALLDGCEILAKPKEAGIAEQFMELLEGFCSDVSQQSRSQEELLLGRPWLGMDQKTEKVRVFFRLRDLEDFLNRKGFKYYTRSQISSKLTSTEIKAVPKFFKIKGKGVNTWHIDPPEQQAAPFDLPDMGEDVL